MIKYKYTINGDYTRCNKNIIEEFNSKKQILEGADLEDFIWSDSMENNPNCKETIIKARKKGRSNFSFNEYCKVYSPEDYRAQKESKPEWTNSFLADKYFVWSDSMEENPNCIETVIRRHLDTNEIDKVTNRKNRNYGKYLNNTYCKVYSPEDLENQKKSKAFQWSNLIDKNPKCKSIRYIKLPHDSCEYDFNSTMGQRRCFVDSRECAVYSQEDYRKQEEEHGISQLIPAATLGPRCAM